MRVLVESFLKRGHLGELETDTGVLHALAEGGAPPREAAKGAFMKLGRETAFFYAQGGAFVLRVGEDVAMIHANEVGSSELAGTKVVLEGDGLRRLSVVKNGETVLAHQYPNPVNPPMELDATLAEEEDFDLGLFAFNVLGSEKRRRFLLGKWGR
ncbi:MAG: hypothetical protein HOV80_13420 [Polyangiaceae bacterium]|nr:hypothetical protein [Polyangiaceae bacterium]